MKTFKLLIFGILLILASSAQGQLSVRVHVGTPPAWAPSGYSNVRYYYLPDVEAYYDVQTSMFIYMSGNTWVRRSYLPDRYRNYDLYHGYKVVMTGYHGNTPYTNFREYRMKYSKGYQGNPQRNVGDRNYQNNNHQGQHMMAQPNRQNNQKMINQNQDQRNNDGKGNNKVQQRGNDNNKKDRHDNGNQN